MVCEYGYIYISLSLALLPSLKLVVLPGELLQPVFTTKALRSSLQNRPRMCILLGGTVCQLAIYLGISDPK